MGCWTAYVLRAEDGSCWAMGQKWGDWYLAREGDRARTVEAVLRGGVAVGDERARDLVDSWFCRGVALDLVTRRYRYFGCGLLKSGAAYLESAALRLASAPGWAGWDVGYAWAGREDLAAVAPEVRPVVVAPADTEATPLDAALTSRDGWFVGWNPVHREISVLYHETIADWFAPANAVVSIIAPDGIVMDYQLAVNGIVPFLAQHGEPLPAKLLAHAPYPMPAEETADSGAVIDLAARRLRYWTADSVPPQLMAKSAARWPGWVVERLPFGFIGHLAATGRDGEDLVMTDAELCEGGWEADLIDVRNGGRAALRTDPRSLRPPRIRVVEEA
ncbi:MULTISPECIES: hypothetical protein [Thermomonosporaceae]|uniref:hypothetical protein n=1 Tax=Thermomonosporaceae TaxID=2012 RepID=UPI00255B371B|nr:MULTISPECIES: hypothetical protein [Thermomonosporaceae]MDL4775817.1 hypothetical protein [Actinomadura xylanilytica]